VIVVLSVLAMAPRSRGTVWYCWMCACSKFGDDISLFDMLYFRVFCSTFLFLTIFYYIRRWVTEYGLNEARLNEAVSEWMSE